MTNGTVLPIRRLTLYKHGVCFVEREGRITGENVALTFRADDINDALKSLLVVDRSGGHALGIGYDTPPYAGARPAGGSITLSPDHSLLDLLRGLRGWLVRLVAGEGSAVEEHSGRLLGVDVADDGTRRRGSIVTVLDEGRGTVVAVRLNRVRQVILLEDRAASDLSRFLDVSRGRNEHRTATVRLSPGEHDLAVSYLVPSPSWRVTYRLVVEAAAEESAPSAPPDTAAELLVQGWGLFDNGLEEDLDAVQVTLVAGQPISFVYDLAASYIPERAVVKDEARVAAGPVEYTALAAYEEMPAHYAGAAPVARMAQMSRMAGASLAEVAQQQVAATGSDLGELFQYEVTTPVTVRRGASALVPILSSRLPCRRELLFNEAKLPGHPVAALRFTNATGLVLERGPVTVLEEGTYRGEAMLPFSKDGAEVYLAYLVELGIHATTETTTKVETVGLRIDGSAVEIKQAMIRTTGYRIDNTLPESRRMIVEHAILPDSELVDVRAPDTRTATFYRWAVACPARAATTFTVLERRYLWQSSQLFDQSYAALHEYWQAGWLDGAMLSRLQGLFTERAAVAANRERINALKEERTEIYAREEQTRHNIGALGTTGDEGALRKRAVTQLQESEERLEAIHIRIAALQEENERRQAAVDERLAHLRVDV